MRFRRRHLLLLLAVLGSMAVVPPSLQASPIAHPAVVSVGPSSFSPTKVTIRYPGGIYSGEVMWFFSNAALFPTSVTDSTGLNLYDTGQRHSPYEFNHIFRWAGDYPYRSTTNDAKGIIRVAMSRHPHAGSLGTAFSLTWASARRRNCVFDVEVHRRGAAHWSFLKFGTSALTGTFTPRSTGVYAVRSRLRNTVSKAYSKFSPSVFIDVT
jgi:hypothetical protein